MNVILKSLYFTIGCISCVVGVVGIFLPLVPTVPCILLTSFCFAKSSPRFHTWILAQPQFGPVIADWEENNRIKKTVKVKASIAIVVSIGISACIVPGVGVRVVLIVIGCTAILFLATRKG